MIVFYIYCFQLVFSVNKFFVMLDYVCPFFLLVFVWNAGYHRQILPPLTRLFDFLSLSPHLSGSNMNISNLHYRLHPVLNNDKLPKPYSHSKNVSLFLIVNFWTIQ